MLNSLVRGAALFAALVDLPAQVFLTGTDEATFGELRGTAELLRAHASAAGTGLEPG